MEKGEMISILEQWVNGSLDPDGLRIIREWARNQEEETLREVMEAYAPILLRRNDFPQPDHELLTRIQLKIGEGRSEEKTLNVRRLPGFFRIAAAAVIILLLGTGIWWLIRRQSFPTPISQTGQPGDVEAPFITRATLTLSNGQHLALDSTTSGTLALQGNAMVVKDENGKLSYKVKNITSRELLYNTLTNPRGSPVIHLLLQDGTQVWLNSESSIRYPVAFTGSDRPVEITGEVYFEVANDPGRPFHVRNGNTTVDVLGTSFNINAYPDEPAIKVTLLEGKVQVSRDAGRVLLSPGQQAIIASRVERAGSIDTGTVMAWKNGRFAFHDADLHTVMRQLARWYNVEVRYEGNPPEAHFSGRIGRTLSLDQVLRLLTRARIHYTIVSNKQLVIRP